MRIVLSNYSHFIFHFLGGLLVLPPPDGLPLPVLFGQPALPLNLIDIMSEFCSYM